jgi:hypothetical protein
MSTSDQTDEQRKNVYEMWVVANEQTNEFARTGLASLLLLNGGAIVAFAPIGSMFEISVASVRTAVIMSLLLYVIGLICALISYFMGFFVNSELSLMMQYHLIGQPADEIEVSRQRHNKMRFIGICTALGGFACFVAGSGTAAAILLGFFQNSIG